MIEEPRIIKKKKFGKKNIIITAIVLLISVVGISYAFFNYYGLSSKKQEIIAGEMYLNLVDGTKDLRLETIFPQTASEARSRTDNVITFDVTGKNTSENKIVYYEIMLNEGIEEEGKTRFNPEHLVFDLVEIINGKETRVVNAVSYDKLNKTRIWVNTVNNKTNEDITITYKLRMWLSENIIISDTESYADYTTEEYRNSYASVKVSVYGDLKEKKVETLASTLETSLAANLTEPDVDGTRYVTGDTVDNNYVWYSGKMWRIVALNRDGTVKLVTQNNMTSIAWSIYDTNTDYSTSQIRSWLNTEFLPTINESLIVESNWDYTTYASFPTEKDTENAISVPNKVGLLTIYDFMMTGGATTANASKTFLNNGYYWWAASPQTSGSVVWSVNNYGYTSINKPNMGLAVRPSIILKSDIVISHGIGENNNPYIIEGDKKNGTVSSLLNNRTSGEYINFNNTLYRIVGIEEVEGQKLTKVTMADYSVNNNALASVGFGSDKTEIFYNPTYGVGLYLENWYQADSTSETYSSTYITDTYKSMIATVNDGVTWYTGPSSGTGLNYTLSKTGTPVSATIGLGYYGEMFSTQFGSGYGSSNFTWLMTIYSYSTNGVWDISTNGGAYTNNPDVSYSIRPSFYLKSNVKIESGSGLPNDPYEIYYPLASTFAEKLTGNLTEPDVDGTRYVKGEKVDNNYVWYSGKIWRIVALNSDGTVKLVTQDNMTSISWSLTSTDTNYSTSQIRNWLNDNAYFLGTINTDLIEEKAWNYTTYGSFPTINANNSQSTATDKVGLLSVYEYMKTGGTDSESTSKSYLNNGYYWWTISPKIDGSDIWYVSNFNHAYNHSPTYFYGVRPSVVIKAKVTLTGEGKGTIETPYILSGDTSVGKTNELLSTRISGEYIKFNDIKYRIVGTENGLTKVTMADYNINKNTLKTSVQFGASDDEITFSSTYGIGKYLDDWYNATSENDTEGMYVGLYLSSTAKAMIATTSDGVVWYAGPDTEGAGRDYKKSTQGTSISATIGLGRYGEMFSSQFGSGHSLSTNTWLITKYNGTNVRYVSSYNYANYDVATTSNGVRPSFYLKSNVKITGGTGMPHEPYTISQ